MMNTSLPFIHDPFSRLQIGRRILGVSVSHCKSNSDCDSDCCLGYVNGCLVCCRSCGGGGGGGDGDDDDGL